MVRGPIAGSLRSIESGNRCPEIRDRANFYNSEIEAVVEEVPAVTTSFTAACAVRPQNVVTEKLAVFFHTPAAEEPRIRDVLGNIRKHLARWLGLIPEFLLPVAREDIPKSPIGKLMRSQPAKRFESGELSSLLEWVDLLTDPGTSLESFAAPSTGTERRIASIWQEVLEVGQVDLRANFFELGGHSLHLIQVHEQLQEAFGPRVSLVVLFKYPTVESLAGFLAEKEEEGRAAREGRERAERRRALRSVSGETGIAVIGMACRFPGANDPDAFWRNLRDGAESITFFSGDEIDASWIDIRSAHDPNYVHAGSIITDVESFDAGFFGFSAREAALTDPQQRLSLECAWEAMENAGYDPLTWAGKIPTRFETRLCW